MDHQDYNVITFNTVHDNKLKIQKEKEKNKIISQKTNNIENIKYEPVKNLGLIISQARIAKNIKTQKDFANLLGVSVQVINNWENNKLIPSNLEISNIEKKLGIKLPRNKKIIIDEK